MNKRFLSTLLTGAIFLAATSMFVSCKDYDDDIKNLQSQIDKAALKSEVDALQTQLTSVSSNASAAMSKAEQAIAAAAAAQKTADAAATKEALEAVKKTAEDAAAAAATAIKAAADAQKTADAAATKEALEAVKKAAEDAAKKAEETYATKAELEAAKKAAADATEAAKKLAELAQAAADKAQLTADDAAKIAAAAKELAEAEAKAVAAQAAAEAAQAAADKANEGVANLTSQLENYATLAVTNKLAEDLNGKLDALKAEIEEAAETNLEALALVVAGYGAAIDELYKAVSSVELVASYSGRLDNENEALQFPLGAYINNNDRERGLTLDFIFGKQKFTSKFGDKETESLFEDANEIIEYTEGADIRAKQALLVRVNPVNATFTKEQVKFIDSKGRNLDELVTIGEPYRYQGLITRGETVESGLWVIPVSVKENTELKDFNLVTFNEREYYATEEEAKKANANFETDPKKPGDPILYAVAINNTTDEERYVASTYDVAAKYSYFSPSSVLNFNLTSKDSEGKPFYGTSGYRANSYWGNAPLVHNRWTSYVYDLQKPGIQSADQGSAYTEKNPEQAWVYNTEAIKAGWLIPAAEAKKESDKLYNTANDTQDYRFNSSYFTIESVGQKITVELPEKLKQYAEYWYITFDFQKNAVESAPSEWEAWQSYRSQIDGIYTMTRAAEKIDLVINTPKAQGDVIGFRVWAVNYDGSLLDPDGKAFYVKVGDIETKKVTLTAEVLALDETKGMSLDSLRVNYSDDSFEKFLKRDEGVNYGVAELADDTFEALGFWDSKYGTFTGTGTQFRNGVTIYWALYQKDKKKLATNWNNIKYLVVGVKGVQLKDWLNGSSVTLNSFSELRNESSNPIQYQLEIAAKKVMPTAANIPADYKFIWKPDYDPTASKVLTVYPVATADAFATAYTNNTFYWQGASGTLKSAVADATWDALAVSGERKMEDYVSGEFLANENVKKLYSFAFAGLPNDRTSDPKTAAYTTDWNDATALKGGNTVIQLFPAAIDHGYATNLNFTFKNISGTKEDNTWTTNYDYAVAAQSFTTQFKDAVDLLTYTTEYSYPVYQMKEDGSLYRDANGALVVTSTDKSDVLYVKWVSDNLTGGSAVTDYHIISSKQGDFLYNGNKELLDLIQLNSSAANIVLAYDAKLLSGENMATVPAGEKKFRTDLYSINNPATNEVEKLTFKFTGNVAKYIEPADEDDITAGYKKKGGAANPTANMTGSIVITGYDTFGKKHDFEFPVVILFDK